MEGGRERMVTNSSLQYFCVGVSVLSSHSAWMLLNLVGDLQSGARSALKNRFVGEFLPCVIHTPLTRPKQVFSSQTTV